MSRSKALAKNTLILSFGTVVPRAVSIITLPIITGCLTKTEYGTFDLVTSMVTLLLPLVTLQLQAAAFRFLIDVREDEDKKKAIVTNILLVTTMISAAVLTVLFFLLSSLDLLTRVLICSFYLFDILASTLRQIARGLAKNKLYSASVMIGSLVELLAVIGFVLLLSDGLNGALFASVLGSFLSLCVLCWKLRIFSFLDVKSMSAMTIREMIGYSWPLIPNSLSSWIISLSDRLIISLMLGVEANAIYAAASKIPSMLGIVQSSFNLAWQENASITLKDRDSGEYYSKVFDTVFCLVAGCLAVLIALSPFLFSILIQGDYQEAYIHTNILFLGAFASCISGFLGGIYIAHMKTKEIGITTTVAACINLVVKITLIPIIGISAASISYVLCYALLAIYRAEDMQKFQRIDFKIGKIILTTLVLILMVLLSILQTSATIILVAGLGIATALILNYRLLSSIVKQRKLKKM